MSPSQRYELRVQLIPRSIHPYNLSLRLDRNKVIRLDGRQYVLKEQGNFTEESLALFTARFIGRLEHIAEIIPDQAIELRAYDLAGNDFEIRVFRPGHTPKPSIK